MVRNLNVKTICEKRIESVLLHSKTRWIAHDEVEATPGRQHSFGSRVLSSFLVDICGVSYEFYTDLFKMNRASFWCLSCTMLPLELRILWILFSDKADKWRCRSVSTMFA